MSRKEKKMGERHRWEYGKCSRELKSNAELLRLTTDLGEIITEKEYWLVTL